MKQLKVTIAGIRPLIMSNPQTVQISNEYSKKGREIGKKLKEARKKADEDKLIECEGKQMRLDWEASAYWDAEEGKFYIPDTLIMASIKAGAMAFKKGKDIDRAVIVSETQAYLQTKPFKSFEDAYADRAFRMEGPCRIPPRTGALIWKCRCQMPTGWKASFTLTFDDNIIAEKTLRDAIEHAGLMVGMGSWRPKFGRFLVTFNGESHE